MVTNKEFWERLEQIGTSKDVETLPAICRVLRPELVSCDAENMEAVTAFDVREQMGNPVGWLHGGMTAAICDNGMGMLAACFADGNFAPTVSIHLEYLRPTPSTGRIYLKAKIVKPGRTLIHVRCELLEMPNSDKPYASATAIYSIQEQIKM